VFYLRGFYGNPFNIPVGGGMFYVGATAPNSNFVLPAGQAISRTTYATLFALVSTTFGVGDGTTTFNVPDIRGRTLFALDNLNGTAANVLQASTTISTTSGSPTATVGSATNIAPGMVVVSTNVPAATTVSAISGTTVTLSANATATASGTAARFSALSDAQTIGATGGAQNHTLATPEIPTITPAGTVALSGAGSVATTNAVANGPTSGGANLQVVGTASITAAFTGTAFGGGLPHIQIPPAMALPFILRVI
jgi:microcystin-dependent protein